MGEMNMNQTTQPEVSKKLTKKILRSPCGFIMRGQNFQTLMSDCRVWYSAHL